MIVGGRYLLLRRVASGGMGEVWEAEIQGEQGFSRRVALKRMGAELAATGTDARMFLDEARIASQLHHANIVGIIDFGMDEGRPFQVLELVDGLDVATLERLGRAVGHPLPVELALHVCAEVAHALQYAHEAVDAQGQKLRIVHRDVTPQNILISAGGDVKLSDFGIAVAEGRLTQTLAGVAKGKPAFMSPEQATAGHLDARTDVFALGCVLHALIAGQTPLAGENRLTDLLAGVELPIAPSIDPDVRAIVQKAIRRAKHERFQCAEELAEACSAALRARLDRDPRPVLRAYVAEVRRLDAASAPGSPVAVRGAVHAPDDDRTGEIVTPAGVASAASRRARWKGLALFGGLAALAAVAISVAAGSAARVEPAVSTLPAPPPPVLEDLPEIVSVVPEEEAPKAAPPARAPAVRRTSADAEPSGLTAGVLAIGGAALHRSEIFVDGRSHGYAPKLLELPAGEHSVELLTPSGDRIEKRLKVTPRHTHTSPLRWIEPAE